MVGWKANPLFKNEGGDIELSDLSSSAVRVNLPPSLRRSGVGSEMPTYVIVIIFIIIAAVLANVVLGVLILSKASGGSMGGGDFEKTGDEIKEELEKDTKELQISINETHSDVLSTSTRISAEIQSTHEDVISTSSGLSVKINETHEAVLTTAGKTMSHDEDLTAIEVSTISQKISTEAASSVDSVLEKQKEVAATIISSHKSDIAASTDANQQELANNAAVTMAHTDSVVSGQVQSSKDALLAGQEEQTALGFAHTHKVVSSEVREAAEEIIAAQASNTAAQIASDRLATDGATAEVLEGQIQTSGDAAGVTVAATKAAIGRSEAEIKSSQEDLAAVEVASLRRSIEAAHASTVDQLSLLEEQVGAAEIAALQDSVSVAHEATVKELSSLQERLGAAEIAALQGSIEQAQDSTVQDLSSLQKDLGAAEVAAIRTAVKESEFNVLSSHADTSGLLFAKIDAQSDVLVSQIQEETAGLMASDEANSAVVSSVVLALKGYVEEFRAETQASFAALECPCWGGRVEGRMDVSGDGLGTLTYLNLTLSMTHNETDVVYEYFQMLQSPDFDVDIDDMKPGEYQAYVDIPEHACQPPRELVPLATSPTVEENAVYDATQLAFVCAGT